MNILFLSRYKWPRVGGVEKHVHEISTRLKTRGHVIKILTEEEVGKDKWEIWRHIWKYKELFDWADVVHIHDVYFWVFFLRCLYLKKKFFITFHGWEEIYPVPVKNIVIRKISELLSNGNICVGEFIKKYYFTNPDYIIYGAANEVKYKKVKRKGAIYVGRVGRSLEYFKQYAKEQKIKLDIFTNNPDASKYFYKYKYAFVSGYLSILEAMSQGTEVISYYDNVLKYDYLNMTPFSEKGYKIPTWEDVASVYEKLWKR